MLTRALARLRDWRAPALELTGFALLAGGAALVFPPAGLLVAGAALVLIAQGVE